MPYQKCPVCNGSGVYYGDLYCHTSAICPTCKGARILDEVTGLPPYEIQVKTSTTIDLPEYFEKYKADKKL